MLERDQLYLRHMLDSIGKIEAEHLGDVGYFRIGVSWKAEVPRLPKLKEQSPGRGGRGSLKTGM